LAKAKAGGSQTQEIEAELERAWEEISELKRERDHAREQASELSAELEAQKAAWATVQQAYPKPQFLPGPTIPEPVGPSLCRSDKLTQFARCLRLRKFFLKW